MLAITVNCKHYWSVIPHFFGLNWMIWIPKTYGFKRTAFRATQFIHTLIIGPYNRSVRITTWLLAPLVMCVLILYIRGGSYSLKSTPKDRFFETLFMTILFTLRVFARHPLRGNRRRNIFCILFWCLAWDSNPGFTCFYWFLTLMSPIHFRLLGKC